LNERDEQAKTVKRISGIYRHHTGNGATTSNMYLIRHH
jgi:hypothetical protein